MGFEHTLQAESSSLLHGLGSAIAGGYPIAMAP